MQGFPPPPDKTITFHDSSFPSFPELRWSMTSAHLARSRWTAADDVRADAG
jgi:hypothetical protein